MGLNIHDDDNDASPYGFKICKLTHDGSLLTELHIHKEEGVCLTSLAFDPHTHRVQFTSNNSHAVHAIDSSSRVSVVIGSVDEKGSHRGTCRAAEARFKRPRVVVDGDGNYVMSDVFAHVVYFFRPARGTVSVLAGSGEAGKADGAAASFNQPLVPAIDHNGSVSLSLLLDNGSIAFSPCPRTATPYLDLTCHKDVVFMCSFHLR